MIYSQKGLDLTALLEGLRLEAYQCSAGVWTIGYGHTKGVKKGDKITKEQALKCLREDVMESEAAVNRLVKVKLTQGQFDALVDFTFNVGMGALERSTLLRLVNAENFKDARKEFPKWNKAGGKVVAGLITRRVKEMEMFIS
jgi:lysozyme